MMRSMRSTGIGFAIVAAGVVLFSAGAWAQGMFDAKPVKLAGKIVFVRDRNIWVMNADGSGQRAWKSSGNVTGRLSWAPDGKRVVYSRQGEANYTLPDGGGGGRKIYDLFASHIDSTREMLWWWVTTDHGSRSPEWSRDGKYILYARDLNADHLAPELPDYQIEYRTFDGTEVHNLTRKGAAPGECQGLDPTWSPDGTHIAFVFQKRKASIGAGGGGAPLTAVGVVVVPTSGITASETELEAQARKLAGLATPVWSPDGRWIACVSSKPEDAGLVLVAPDGGQRRRIVAATDRFVPLGPVSWSPDSRWIVFSSADGFIYLTDSEGKGAPQRLTSGGNDYLPAISPK